MCINASQIKFYSIVKRSILKINLAVNDKSNIAVILH